MRPDGVLLSADLTAATDVIHGDLLAAIADGLCNAFPASPSA